MKAPLKSTLLLDLEIDSGGGIREIGAVLDGESFLRKSERTSIGALEELDEFAAGATRVLGHNLLRHDLPFLRAAHPGLRLLALPVVDTLYLSPLAFPENPYHRLVKDYKLLSATRNDPVADARLAAKVFFDQWEAFSTLAASTPDLAALLRFLFRGAPLGRGGMGDGLAEVFAAVGAPEFRTPLQAEAAFIALTRGLTCDAAGKAVARRLLRERPHAPELAYVATWIRVAGGKSVLPPWVRGEFPEVPELIRELRDSPCGQKDCEYCRTVQDPEVELTRTFGFPRFREIDGRPLQRDIVLSCMAGQPLLALLPTGGGKSLCYQLPAFNRHRRTGALSIVISPLQALMKDQVEGLEKKTRTPHAGAIYGMLTPPERRDVLERVRRGDIAILYVSPEQLRNRSFEKTILHREIGAWVIDEAHCISRWGHDFRPDYFYASRFIGEMARTQGGAPPPVACFTATGKPGVVEEIVAHFRQALTQELAVFTGPVERENLAFEVRAVSKPEKPGLVRALLAERLFTNGAGGAAIVYCRTRRGTEDLAEFLTRTGLHAEAFHAGVNAPEKRSIQERFLAGKTRVISATNAFGMGIDKEDVRLVIHADVPGSLESYLQEAGRAGRDQEPADCLLLFDEQDVEEQFRLGARSKLTMRDLIGILKGVRRAAKRQGAEVILTPGELLREETVDTSIELGDAGADTKVKTALSWLERAGFLTRDENRTEVFQGMPRVKDLEDAQARIAKLDIMPQAARRWLEVLKALLTADPDDGLSFDELAGLSAYEEIGRKAPDGDGRAVTRQVARDLHDLAESGLVDRGLVLSAFVRPRGSNTSKSVFERAAKTEVALLELLREAAPDAESGGWQHVNLRALNTRLKERGAESSPEMILLLLRSLSQDGRGLAGKKGSLELSQASRDSYRAKILRSWDALSRTAKIRRAVAAEILRLLLEKIRRADGGGEEQQVVFTAEEIAARIRKDSRLAGLVTEPLLAIDRGLLFLHEQRAIILRQGLAVFRSAMTIKLEKSAKGRPYRAADYEALSRYYRERVFQVHAMGRYATLGIDDQRAANRFVSDCFCLEEDKFFAKHFAGEEEVVARATGQKSYRQIVEDLENPTQMALVAGPKEENVLVLAGPGSGKTRVVVHRCAYLLRVLRVPPREILVLCFNHNAAVELRRRLSELVGREARGVTVLTYHALAMRLSGASFAERSERAGRDEHLASAAKEDLFNEVLRTATRLLTGKEDVPGVEPDEIRDRLLAGYRYILVDEYQDIDELQYDLISAIAGRTEKDEDQKLTILAVGDDDQNIYSFRGANVRFLNRFREDYRARVVPLVENYRATGNLIDVTNRFIAVNRDRMKRTDPIRVNDKRALYAAGGRYEKLDVVARGRVQRIRVSDPAGEAVAVVGEIKRLLALNPAPGPGDFAVLARKREALGPIRALLEAEGIPASRELGRDLALPLHRIRETARLLDDLKGRGGEMVRASGLLEELRAESGGLAEHPWQALLLELLEAWRETSADAEQPAGRVREFLYEAFSERQRDARIGSGVHLGTIHGAKGLEFPHVLIPATGLESPPTSGEAEEERRVFYVGMTRACETLTLIDRRDLDHPHLAHVVGPAVLLREDHARLNVSREVLDRRYEMLGMADFYLDWAGRAVADDPLHRRISSVAPGTELIFRAGGKHLDLHLRRGGPVARLSKAACERWTPVLDRVREVRVLALIQRWAGDGDPEYGSLLKTDSWEVPVAEVVYRA